MSRIKNSSGPRAKRENLSKENPYYRLLFEESPDGILVIDTSGRIIDFNKAAYHHLGYSREEFAKLTLFDIENDQTPQEIEDSISRVLKDGKSEFEVRHRTKNGELRNVLVIIRTMILSRRTFFNTTWKDITDLKRAEEELYYNYFTQATVNMILNESLDEAPLQVILQKALNIILSIPWIQFEPMGSIHLIDVGGRLTMEAHFNLPDKLRAASAMHVSEIQFGSPAQLGTSTKGSHDEFPCHYVPIICAGRNLGLLTLYLTDTERQNSKEEEFLHAIADTLAGIIVRKQAEYQLEESERKLGTLIDNLPGVVYRCLANADRTIEYMSEGVSKLTGYRLHEISENRLRSFMSLVKPEDRVIVDREINAAISSKRPFTVKYRIIDATRAEKWLRESGSVIFENDKPVAVEGFLIDITDKKKMEEKVEQLAYYDSLTGLPNRNLFIDRLGQRILRDEYNGQVLAVLSIDIDRFKAINNTYGFAAGDEVLKEMARRLQSGVRDGDTVARLGNDHFGIALLGVAESEDIIVVVEKIMKTVSQPVHFDGKEIVLTISVGISVFPTDGEEADLLIRNAEMALRRSKQLGRKGYQFYTESLDKASESVLMEKNLFRAMKNEEFVLFYQPYYDIARRKLTGVEALIRWKSPDGLISPAQFIPVLEDTRMIIEVGEWVLKTAIRQAKKWRDMGFALPVSVNLSLIQFREKNLPEVIERVLRETGLDPSLLNLEITESAFMQDVAWTYSVLERLKNAGVSVSIDDFGTGYSSLAHLKRFPIDNLKIDMSFIREIATDPDTASIVTAIIAMSHTLNLKTVAEGVETEEQWKILHRLGCDMAQGYYLAPPLTAESATEVFLGQFNPEVSLGLPNR